METGVNVNVAGEIIMSDPLFLEDDAGEKVFDKNEGNNS